jgi:hypothetical protein
MTAPADSKEEGHGHRIDGRQVRVVGLVSISLTNLLVIAGLIALFVLALVIPFPRDREPDPRAVDPGVRNVPRWIPVHRLIWREHYRRG